MLSRSTLWLVFLFSSAELLLWSNCSGGVGEEIHHVDRKRSIEFGREGVLNNSTEVAELKTHPDGQVLRGITDHQGVTDHEEHHALGDRDHLEGMHVNAVDHYRPEKTGDTRTVTKSNLPLAVISPSADSFFGVVHSEDNHREGAERLQFLNNIQDARGSGVLFFLVSIFLLLL